MEIHFRDERLTRLCNDSRESVRRMGLASAEQLQRRLDDLQAISNLQEAFTLPGKFHPLARDRAGQFALRLAGGLRLIIVPDDTPLPTRTDGSVDLSRVRSICIIAIEDYHD